MEFPSFNQHHHHNRYIPPPPPPPTNFPDDRPNLYPHHQHLLPSLHLPPPPPLAYPSLPPPPPPPLPIPPPPPSYNPHQSHFTFLDAQSPSFLNHGGASPPQPRFSNQSHRFDYRTDSWSDSHRVPPEPTHRNPPLPDDSSHRRMYAADPRSENHYQPHVPERVIPSGRYRDETIIDGYASRDNSHIVSQEQQAFRGSSNSGDHHGRVIDRYASAQTTGSSSRNLEDFSEPRYISNSEEERIWDHHGEDPRRVHQMKGKKNEFGHNDREKSRDYEYETSRLTRVRDGREEFKQVQKKSVLLRIGKPNNSNRNRNHHMAESNNSNSRGKDKDRDHTNKDSSSFVDHNKMEGDREHSPVELDVSFKSNALVAKAVSSPVIDSNSTPPRNKKIKRFSEFGSPIKSSSKALDCPSSSEKAPKQQKVKDSGKDGVPVLGQAGGTVGPLSFRLKKKRKLINFKNSPSVSIFQLAEKDDKSVKGENKKSPSQSAIPIPFPLEKDSSEVSKINDLSQQPSQNEVSLNLEDDTQQVSTDAYVSLVDTHLSASSGQGQIEIQKCFAESFASFDACSNEIVTILPENLNNVSVKIQEMTTSAGCSDEIITLVPDNVVSSKEEEIVLLESSEDGLKETSNATAIAEDNAVVSSGQSYIPVTDNKMKDSEIQSDFTTPGEKHENAVDVPQNPSSPIKMISSDEDEVVDIVELSPEKQQRPDNRKPIADENYQLLNNDIPPLSSSILPTCSDDKSGESLPDMLPCIVSSLKVSGLPKDQTLSNCNSGIPDNDENTCKKIVSENSGLKNTNPKTSIKTSNLEVTGNLKTATSASSEGLNPKLHGSNLPIKKPNTVPTVFPIRSSPVFTTSRINNNPSAKNIAKPRTWHRSVNNPVSSSIISVPKPPKQSGTVQNAYIRTGNSLVRKGSPVTTISSVPSVSRSSIYQLNPSGPIETRTGGAVVRPKTPPLSGGGTELPDSTTTTVRVLPSSPLEDQNGTFDEGIMGKKIEYVKPKSNQLVAASSSEKSVHELDNKTQALSSSDGYYKRRKNQLVRTSVAGDDSVNTAHVRKVSKINIKRHSGKGISKKYRNTKFSSVWTLGAQSLGVSKLRPHLFPWKRSKYWGNVTASLPSNSSSSLISRKLVQSRKRETIYTRSKHGFSLRMSKLLSVGGSSLKWSKSIEKNSKRANEEATLAVAAAEKKRREQHLSSEAKSRNNNINMSRDRIFRIGLVRYKMDPSRRTLQRISDEEPSTSKQSSKEEETRKSYYVPKRLLIGHDEYLRIGNGNQLVRNPKRRTRLFANEKVRWSLHTARSRLAKKKKYCQFFTRFGKCNKDDDGKCPFIHDSSKIAVCTMFLKGLCSNPDCKLTHKVIPERMQDCSYFLQGLCSNEHCPYRHVNVNSAASVCEGFLKGYCADGNECRKKHTYACPAFEATGECPQHTKCKLHHPSKTKTKTKKRKLQDPHHNNSRGRYFGVALSGGDTLAAALSETHHLKDDDGILFQQGKFAEYISLDFGNEEVIGVSDERRRVTTSERLDLLDDDDELTKPIRLINHSI